MRRGTSVSSAIENPGSRPASSGNSRSSDRQKASMVLTAMSPVRSRSSRQREGAISPRSAARRSDARMRSRISVAAFRVKVTARIWTGSTPAFSRFR